MLRTFKSEGTFDGPLNLPVDPHALRPSAGPGEKARFAQADRSVVVISERTPRASLPGTFLSSKEEGCRKPLPGVCSERQEDDKESSQLVSSSILTSGQPHKLTSGQKKKKKEEEEE